MFLLGPRKFPVPMRREFSGKPLNLLADWAPKFEAEGRILQNSLFVSLLSGNLGVGDRFDPGCIHHHAFRR